MSEWTLLSIDQKQRSQQALDRFHSALTSTWIMEVRSPTRKCLPLCKLSRIPPGGTLWWCQGMSRMRSQTATVLILFVTDSPGLRALLRLLSTSTVPALMERTCTSMEARYPMEVRWLTASEFSTAPRWWCESWLARYTIYSFCFVFGIISSTTNTYGTSFSIMVTSSQNSYTLCYIKLLLSFAFLSWWIFVHLYLAVVSRTCICLSVCAVITYHISPTITIIIFPRLRTMIKSTLQPNKLWIPKSALYLRWANVTGKPNRWPFKAIMFKLKPFLQSPRNDTLSAWNH